MPLYEWGEKCRRVRKEGVILFRGVTTHSIPTTNTNQKARSSRAFFVRKVENDELFYAIYTITALFLLGFFKKISKIFQNFFASQNLIYRNTKTPPNLTLICIFPPSDTLLSPLESQDVNTNSSSGYSRFLESVTSAFSP